MSTLLTSPRAAVATGESAATFAALAERVAAGEFPATSITALVTAARRRRASDVLIGTLLDAAAPVVARQRAFGRLAAIVAAAPVASSARSAA